MPRGNTFPNSAFSYTTGTRYTTGNVYFVDSGATNASDGNDGKSPTSALATLNGAMDKVTANNGDIVYLMPGHAENCSSATTQVIDVAGVKIIGIGDGSDRPTFTYTATGGSFEIDAANTHIENVIFLASVSAVVVGINVDAAGVKIVNCEMNFDATGDDFLLFIDIDAVDECEITGCTFIAEDAAGSNRAIRLDNTDNTKIVGNHFFGDFAQEVIGSTSDEAVCANLLVAHNTIMNRDTASAANGIDFDIAHTGLIAYNTIATLQATNVYTLLDPGSCLCVENYVVNAVDEHGVVAPQTASTT